MLSNTTCGKPHYCDAGESPLLPLEQNDDLSALATDFLRGSGQISVRWVLMERQSLQGGCINVLVVELIVKARQAYPTFEKAVQKELASEHLLKALLQGLHVQLPAPASLQATSAEEERDEGWAATGRDNRQTTLRQPYYSQEARPSLRTVA
ncbi:hypothetical protein P4O66_002792 [Electrophorus voltai]|uniref:Uncharacterized protein n=1 Tax=Electrophorus voltai TaxID=2609070 RepID=A0AAD8YV26_9TELE|nr:hypothetical protein P4O66_002792 [Electrophorus voltai]